MLTLKQDGKQNYAKATVLKTLTINAPTVATSGSFQQRVLSVVLPQAAKSSLLLISSSNDDEMIFIW